MTKNQLKLLAFVEEYRQKHGNGPSYREILAGINVSGVRSVSVIVDALLEKGYLISDQSSRFRSLRLTDDGRETIGRNLIESSFVKTPQTYRVALPFDIPFSSASAVKHSLDVSYEDNAINPGGTGTSSVIHDTQIPTSKRTHQPSLFDGTSGSHQSFINVQNSTLNFPFHSVNLSEAKDYFRRDDYAIVIISFVLTEIFSGGFLWFAVLFFSLFLAKKIDNYFQE